MAGKKWSFRVAGETIVLLPSGETGGDTKQLAPVEAAWAIESIPSTVPVNDALTSADLAAALSCAEGTVGATMLPFEELRRAVAEAVRRGRLVAFRTSRPMRVQREVIVEPLGPESSPDEVQDVFVLAAEVKLLGDTPLIEHAVRILDPDTGEVVAEAKTDDKGIVRTEVPAKKTYRIEIDDHHPEMHALSTFKTPHPVLRCAFVDAAGSPVPDLDVMVRDLDGQETTHTTDDDGRLDLPATRLAPYEIVVDGESHWVHSLLGDGSDDTYEIVVSPPFEDGADGIDPDDRLARSWAYEEDDDDDDDVGLGGLA